MNHLPDPSYLIEIDEEGFPMFSGIRSSDEVLNFEILGNIRRSEPPRMASRLMTEFDHGKLAWVDAFDDPLVVQSIDVMDSKSPDAFTAKFPGKLKANFKLQELQVDAFSRFHFFVGESKIPAVFSRKAQAALLHIPGVPERLIKAPVFRISESPAEDSQFWSELYDNGGDQWELGQASPPIKSRFLNVLGNSPQKICVPASGRGHEAAMLAESGHLVSAVDFSERARSEFQKIYPTSKVEYRVENVFDYFKKNSGQLDGICEHTFYCAIPPLDRVNYWKSVAGALKPGGLLFGLFYLKTHSGGPPYGCTQWEIREFSKTDFEIEDWSVAKDSIARRQGEELWVALRRR